MLNDITLDGSESEGAVLELNALVKYLEQIPDRRGKQGLRYPLWFVLVAIVLAKLCGENKPNGIAEWVKLRREQLVAAFERQRQTVPSLNTIRRTLADAVAVADLQAAFKRFLHRHYGGQQSVLVTLDGKTLRGTIASGESQGVHLLAAYLPSEGIVLMQVAIDKKENELSAAPQVLSALDLKGRVVCGDALFTQRNLSVQILYQGGDYIWFVKDNQPRLRQDVAQFFVPPRNVAGWRAPSLPQAVAQKTRKGHGRLEQRTLTAMADETGFINWPGLQQVLQLERKVIVPATGEVTVETVYGITSLSPERASAAQLLEWSQSYWGIENGLHYRRDVTLQEDATRMSNHRQAQAIAVMNNFIIGLASKLGFANLASARRVFNAKVSIALSDYG